MWSHLSLVTFIAVLPCIVVIWNSWWVEGSPAGVFKEALLTPPATLRNLKMELESDKTISDVMHSLRRVMLLSENRLFLCGNTEWRKSNRECTRCMDQCGKRQPALACASKKTGHNGCYTVTSDASQ